MGTNWTDVAGAAVGSDGSATRIAIETISEIASLADSTVSSSVFCGTNIANGYGISDGAGRALGGSGADETVGVILVAGSADQRWTGG